MFVFIYKDSRTEPISTKLILAETTDSEIKGSSEEKTTSELQTSSVETKSEKEQTEDTRGEKETTTATEYQPNYNLNTATVKDLMTVYGIGQAKAEAIVAYRDSIGGFLYREQLLDISGIGTAVMNNIMDCFYIPDEIAPTELQTETETWMMTEFTETEESETITIQDETEIRVNLNRANLEELMQIPELTEEMGKEIIHLREQIHSYSNPLELLYCEHISSNEYEKIKDYVYVEDSIEK